VVVAVATNARKARFSGWLRRGGSHWSADVLEVRAPALAPGSRRPELTEPTLASATTLDRGRRWRMLRARVSAMRRAELRLRRAILVGVSVAVLSTWVAIGMALAAGRSSLGAERGSCTVTFACSRGVHCRTDGVTSSARDRVVEFRIAYPRGAAGNPPGAAAPGSTHELTFNPRAPNAIWVTGQNQAEVVRLGLHGQKTFFPMPVGSGPHGIVFDRLGRLWVGLEFAGALVRLDSHGTIVQRVSLPRDCPSCGSGVAPGPHGLAVSPDGRTLWYTGKEAGVVGRVSPNGAVRSFRLPEPDSKPIYITAGPDGNMWFTELTGNKIGRITPSGHLREFTIPTPNSRPIAIIADPHGRALWFSEEASDKIGRIDLAGRITEFPVPKSQPNQILAGLAFDRQGNLWVEQYIDQNHPSPAGPDRLVRIAGSMRASNPKNLSAGQFTFFDVPTRKTVMHRIILGPDGNMWFTELTANKVGRILTSVHHQALRADRPRLRVLARQQRTGADQSSPDPRRAPGHVLRR
jgi:virginiamycin B lyase